MSQLLWTGERFIPGEGGPEIAYEHYSRYLFAAALAGDRRVLDIGSGEGYGTYLLAQSAREVLGVDPSNDAVLHAAERYRRANLEFRPTTATALGAGHEGRFDLVTCFEVIEHVSVAEQHAILEAVSRLLSPTGILVVSTPNRPVYRAVGAPANEFHVSEMDFFEFRDFLAAHLGAVRWYAQGPLSGNLLQRVPGVDDAVHGDAVQGDTWRVDLVEVAKGGMLPSVGTSADGAKYFLAVAAHQPHILAALALPRGLVFVDGRETLERDRAAMARWAMAVETELKNTQRDYQALDGEKTRVVAELGQCRERFTTDKTRLEGELSESRAAAAGVAALFKAELEQCRERFTTEKTRLEGELSESRAAAAGAAALFKAELEQCRERFTTEKTRLEGELSESRAAAAGAAALFKAELEQCRERVTTEKTRLEGELSESRAAAAGAAALFKAELEQCRATSVNETTRLSAELARLEAELAQCRTTFAERVAMLDESLEASRAHLELLNTELTAAAEEKARLSQLLGQIHGTNMWRIAQQYYQLRDRFFLVKYPYLLLKKAATVWRDASPPAPALADAHRVATPVPHPPPAASESSDVASPTSMPALTAEQPALTAEQPAVAAEQPALTAEQLEPYLGQFRALAARCRLGGITDPSFLDWHSSLKVGDVLREEVVFSPWTTGTTLPYLDRSVHVVVVPDRDAVRLAEACRVASVAVVIVEDNSVEWVADAGESTAPSVSVIVPVCNHAKVTEDCLLALEATLPKDWAAEVIVVDDASTDETPQMLAQWMRNAPWLRAIRNVTNSGFIDSCNHGAKEAHGEILVFLNNDTLPQPGWLEALVDTLRSHRDAGAVGGKLLWPDGRIQEAGGAIFSDGSGFNVGRGEPDRDAPAFSFVREVDYCSGALLATPRTLFWDIGGFDVRFRPAYYEDADYCFAVRAKGLKVYYQPSAVITHLEGVSNGTDTARGIKHHQAINREIFLEKWKKALEALPPPPLDASYRSMHSLVAPRTARRAVVMSHTLPEFDLEGGSRRVFHLVRFLREAGWMVSFMAPWVPGGERYERVLRQMGVAAYPRGLRKLEGDDAGTEADRLLATGQLDLAIIAFWHTAERWTPIVRRVSPSTRIVVDSIDLHFLRNARKAFLPSTAGDARGLDPTYGDDMRREMNQYDAADAVLTVSQREASLVNDLLGRDCAHTVPDCENAPDTVAPFAARNGFVFLGSLRHPPNIEAVEWLCEHVWPNLDQALLAKHPISIVGTGLDEKFARLADGRPGIKMVGWVPSATPYLQHARVSLVPLRHGAGTKRKLIQAALMGTPSVSTPIGAEGLGLTHGGNVLIASDPAEFAREMTRLVTHERLWAELSVAACTELSIRHSPENSAKRFMEVIEQVLR